MVKRSPLPRRSFLAPSAAIAAAGALAPSAFAAVGDTAGRSRGDVVDQPGPGRFPLVADLRAAPLVVSGEDFPGVVRVVTDLRDDVERVTGVAPEVITGNRPTGTVEQEVRAPPESRRL